MTASRREWVDRFAVLVGVTPPTDAEIEVILELAGSAAHASERTAAPIACWLAAQAQLTPDDAVERAAGLRRDLDGEVDDLA